MFQINIFTLSQIFTQKILKTGRDVEHLHIYSFLSYQNIKINLTPTVIKRKIFHTILHYVSLIIYQRMLCVKFGWNWDFGSGERFLHCIFTISLLTLFGKECESFHLNKLEFHSHKDVVEIDHLVLSKRWFKIAFSLFSYFLPLEKSVALEGCLVPSLLEIGPLVLEKIFITYFCYFGIIPLW